MSYFRKVDPLVVDLTPSGGKKVVVHQHSDQCTEAEFKIVAVDQLVNENNEGQKLNPARSQGIDWVNVATISNSFLVKGFDVTLI